MSPTSYQLLHPAPNGKSDLIGVARAVKGGDGYGRLPSISILLFSSGINS